MISRFSLARGSFSVSVHMKIINGESSPLNCYKIMSSAKKRLRRWIDATIDRVKARPKSNSLQLPIINHIIFYLVVDFPVTKRLEHAIFSILSGGIFFACMYKEVVTFRIRYPQDPSSLEFV